MVDRTDIPRPTVKRLSFYLREAERRMESGATTISSRQLGEALDIADTQVRKDLGHFGQIGRSGIGYQAQNLVMTLRRILGLDRRWNAILLGAGNIGRALLAYPPFAERGFRILAAFDKRSEVVGQEFEGVMVHSVDELGDFVAENDVHLGLVAVPAEAAQGVAEQLVDAGVRGILNFAPTRLHVAAGVVSVDLSRSLEMLAFQVSQGLTGEATLEH
ncbi:MAG: redox-sensing transcriptional repressor Rex [Phycisphaerales bacterium]|nr:redox-sensing transcriptional repressor Rex [Phycisphaerales bacterium]